MTADAMPNVNLTNCDREPIHLLGTVQPFGFLLVLSKVEWLIERVSENAPARLGREPSALLQQPLVSVFASEAVHTIRGQLQAAILGNTRARIFGLTLAPGLVCDVAVHMSGDSVIVECEPTQDDNSFHAAASVSGMASRLRECDTERAFFRVAARDMRAMTGFDRVMIYRFEHDGSGEVVAEHAAANLESYLGLHYPASDIPKQARRLYEENWLRIIPDINAAPVPIVPRLDARGQPVDLSMSVLRSVSSIHIEYLRNMGVQASMSVSILRQGKLWGLFACHHYSPHYLGFGVRTAAELYGQIFSLMLENREREGESSYEARAHTLHQRLISVMAHESAQMESVVAHLDDLADLLTCDGVGLWVGGRAVLKGRTPSPEQFAGLMEHLNAREIVDVYARHEIGAEYPPAREFAANAAGMLVVPLSRPARDYLVFFREEVARYVSWAGDPRKSVTVGPLGDRLTPRRSFELWKEAVRGQSLPWKPVECRIAENLRVSLLEVILRLTSATAEERRRGQERQELLIAELNHRVRNILGLIRGVLSQSRDTNTSVESFMSVVGGRIQALARAHDLVTTDQWGPASFRGLVEAEAAAYLGRKAERVVIDGPDALLEPQAFTTVALVLHEMVTNSAKYGALSDSRGRVDISTRFDHLGRYAIVWVERGGPPVKPPTRRGFGSVIIERSIKHDLRGESDVTFEVAGVRADFVIPSVHVTAHETQARRAAPSAEAASDFSAPADVLIVEDNMIIALDCEDIVMALGVKNVRIASSVSTALQMIAEQQPDFALLDINLGEETSFDIAKVLLERSVPFAFASGYGEQVVFPSEYADVVRVRKPYDAKALKDALAKGAIRK